MWSGIFDKGRDSVTRNLIRMRWTRQWMRMVCPRIVREFPALARSWTESEHVAGVEDGTELDGRNFHRDLMRDGRAWARSANFSEGKRKRKEERGERTRRRKSKSIVMRV